MARIVSERYCRIFQRKIALYGLLIFWSGFCLISGGDATAAELTRLRISIPGLGTTSYPLIMAQKKGYFRTEGYDVELIPMTGGLAVKTLMAGEVNLTSAGTLVASMQGAKLRMVMGFLRQLPTTWWPRRRSNESKIYAARKSPSPTVAASLSWWRGRFFMATAWK